MKRKKHLDTTVHFPTRIQNKSNTALDNIFIDNYKFTKYNVSPIYNGLSDQDVQLLAITDISLQTVNNVATVLETQINILWKNLRLD
jgi:hypothetical protein